MKLRATLVVALVAACGSKDKPAGKQATPQPLVTKQDKDIPEGLDLKLSDGKQGADAYDASKIVPARKLGDADVQQLLARAQPLQAQANDQLAFALRPATLTAAAARSGPGATTNSPTMSRRASTTPMRATCAWPVGRSGRRRTSPCTATTRGARSRRCKRP